MESPGKPPYLVASELDADPAMGDGVNALVSAERVMDLHAIRAAIARVEAEARASVAAENRAYIEARARAAAEERAQLDHQAESEESQLADSERNARQASQMRFAASQKALESTRARARMEAEAALQVSVKQEAEPVHQSAVVSPERGALSGRSQARMEELVQARTAMHQLTSERELAEAEILELTMQSTPKQVLALELIKAHSAALKHQQMMADERAASEQAAITALEARLVAEQELRDAAERRHQSEVYATEIAQERRTVEQQLEAMARQRIELEHQAAQAAKLRLEQETLATEQARQHEQTESAAAAIIQQRREVEQENAQLAAQRQQVELQAVHAANEQKQAESAQLAAEQQQLELQQQRVQQQKIQAKQAQARLDVARLQAEAVQRTVQLEQQRAMELEQQQAQINEQQLIVQQQQNSQKEQAINEENHLLRLKEESVRAARAVQIAQHRANKALLKKNSEKSHLEMQLVQELLVKGREAAVLVGLTRERLEKEQHLSRLLKDKVVFEQTRLQGIADATQAVNEKIAAEATVILANKERCEAEKACQATLLLHAQVQQKITADKKIQLDADKVYLEQLRIQCDAQQRAAQAAVQQASDNVQLSAIRQAHAKVEHDAKLLTQQQLADERGVQHQQQLVAQAICSPNNAPANLLQQTLRLEQLRKATAALLQTREVAVQ